MSGRDARRFRERMDRSYQEAAITIQKKFRRRKTRLYDADSDVIATAQLEHRNRMEKREQNRLRRLQRRLATETPRSTEIWCEEDYTPRRYSPEEDETQQDLVHETYGRGNFSGGTRIGPIYTGSSSHIDLCDNDWDEDGEECDYP